MLFRKTRIALEYASYHENSDSVSVFWIHASTAERMKKAYQEIAKEARLVGARDPKVDQLQLVKQWLEDEDSGNWVMIIDNADDENLFFGEDEDRAGGPFSFSNTLARYFPRRPNGSILLTTRNKKLGVKFAGVRGAIAIPKMSISESKSLLVEKLEDNHYDDNDLTELVQILENLPLALVQAAAFMGENSQSIDRYLQIYRGCDSSKIKLLSQNFEDNERDLDSKNPVAVTWAISFEQIKKNDHRAAELLSLMSVFDRQAIPQSLLLLDKDEVELEKALGTLKAFSLITPEHGRQAFNLHRLVYIATRNWLTMKKELDFWTGKALILLSEHFPKGTYEYREIWMVYLPHALTVLNSGHLPASENITQATLLFNVSEALRRKGDYDPSEMMAQRSLDLRRKVLGERNFETLCSLRNLGMVLWKKGRHEKAEEISRQALKGFEEMQVKEHTDTIESVDILGIVFREQGKYEAAENLHRQALSVREKVLGKEHPDTLHSLNNLAVVFEEQGKYEAAENLHRQALSVREKVLGEEHPHTLGSVNNLAVVLEEQGNYEAAEKFHQRALSVREKVLGKEHPVTLESVNNLAVVFKERGSYEAAEKLHRRALDVREKVLGKEHPDTLASVNNLAVVLEEQGNYEAAEKLDRQALSVREKVLGKEHPVTLESVNNLAVVLEEQGDYETAEKLNRRALGAREKVLGKEHSETLRSVKNLARVLQRQGRFEEAVRLFQQALSGREKTLGKEHPQTFSSLSHLAMLAHERCQYQDALPLYQIACAGFEKTLGSGHPQTQSCAKNFSRMLDEMRDSETKRASGVDAES